MMPVVGAFAIRHPGKERRHQAGTPFTAYLDSTSLVASNQP